MCGGKAAAFAPSRCTAKSQRSRSPDTSERARALITLTNVGDQQANRLAPADSAAGVFVIDPKNEDLISLGAAAKLPELRRDGKAIHLSTLWRWMADGRLEHVRVGGRTLTSREAVSRMLAQCNPGQPQLAVPSPRQREKQLRDAEARLAKAGI